MYWLTPTGLHLDNIREALGRDERPNGTVGQAVPDAGGMERELGAHLLELSVDLLELANVAVKVSLVLYCNHSLLCIKYKRTS